MKSFWHLAQIRVEEAEQRALKGMEKLELPHNGLYESITVAAMAPRFVYTANYRQTPDGWPAKGRTTKNLSRKDAIDEVADNLEVARNRELVADYQPEPALPVSDEMQRLFDRVVEDPPLHAPRSLR